MARQVTFVLVALAIAAAAASPARADEPSLQQKIAMTAKPSVVRVWSVYIATFALGESQAQEVIGGTGTGWFMTPDGYIATNAHVVEDVYLGDDRAKKQLLEEFLKEADKASGGAVSKMNQAQLSHLIDTIKLVDLKKREYVVLGNGDKLNYEVVKYGKPGSGDDCAIIKVTIANAPTLPIGDSTKTQVEDHIVVIGYPGVADFKELLDEKSQLQASVTEGGISSLKHAESGEQILQISAPITHGNSGGPAIDQHGNVVGLATFGNEKEVQGFNFLVASSTLMVHVKQESKIDPKPSDTNKAWQSGLEHYWNDEYTDAVKDFEEVETLFPQHAEAAEFIRSAHQAQKDGKEKKSNTGAIVGLVIGGLVLAGAGVFFAMRKKPGAMAPRPSQPMGPPGAYPPPGPAMMPGQPPPQQMYGRAPSTGQTPAGQPVAKTVAVGQPGAPGGIAPTAFGSLTIGTLTCTRGQLSGQRFALSATGIIVGRQPGVAHVLVNDHRASGKHVWIGMENGRLVAIDQGTTNGTFVNDIARGRITRAELRDGDVVIVSEPDCLSLQISLQR